MNLAMRAVIFRHFQAWRITVLLLFGIVCHGECMASDSHSVATDGASGTRPNVLHDHTNDPNEWTNLPDQPELNEIKIQHARWIDTLTEGEAIK